MFKLRLPVTCALPHIGKRLANGATVIVVEDKTITKPAAAMSFGVGKNNDPKEFPGLAHFCEHMLFMGTEKYPSEDAYHTAVQRSGGSCNAFTANDVTCYYFSSGLDSYKSIVDMFLEFFIAPSFNVSAVDRELNAVNSEDERNHTNDARRVEEMVKTFVVEDHPRSRYGSGNITTLKTNPELKGLSVHDALRTFFARYYVSEASCLVLFSPFPSDEMFSLVEPTVLRMKSGALPPTTFVPRGEVLLPNSTGKWCNVLAVSKQPSLQIKWVVPYGKLAHSTSPLSYLSHIIGHEVEGTLLAVLRGKGLVSSLTTGQSEFDGDHSDFNVRVTLTDNGMGRLAEVVTTVFVYIERLRRAGPSDPEVLATLVDMKAERRARFEYGEVGRPSDHCSLLSVMGMQYGGELAFCGCAFADAEAGLPDTFKALDLLTIDRAIIILSVGTEAELAHAADINPFVGDIKLSNTTEFHKMRYSVSDLPNDMLEALSCESLAKVDIADTIHLPAINPFISGDFAVFGPPNPSKVPIRLETQYGYALIKASEAHLQQPKLYAMLNIFLTNNVTVSDKYYREVLVGIVDEALTDILYFASLAGLGLGIVSNGSGLVLRTEGPHAAVPKLLLTLVDKVLDAAVMKQTEEVFARHHKRKVLKLSTAFEGQPAEHALARYVNYFGSDSYFSWEDAFDFCGNATYEGYCAFVDQLLIAGRTELVVDGNMPNVEAIRSALVDPIDALLAAKGLASVPSTAFPPYNDFFVPTALITESPSGHGEEESVASPPPSLYMINVPPFSKMNVNIAVRFTLLLGPSSPDLFPLLKVLGNIISSPFFNTLRSVEALGYAVHSSIGTNHHRIATLTFSVQSPVAPPLYIFSRMYAFIEAFESQVLPNLTDEEINEAVKGIVHSLKQRTTSVADDGRRITSDRNNIYGFDWRDKEIEWLEQPGYATKDALMAVYTKYISHSSVDRVGTVVVVNSDKLAEEEVDYTKPVTMPSMRKKPIDESGAAGGVADTRLVMNTFADEEGNSTGVRVCFKVLSTKAEAHAVSTLVEVPHA